MLAFSPSGAQVSRPPPRVRDTHTGAPRAGRARIHTLYRRGTHTFAAAGPLPPRAASRRAHVAARASVSAEAAGRTAAGPRAPGDLNGRTRDAGPRGGTPLFASTFSARRCEAGLSTCASSIFSCDTPAEPRAPSDPVAAVRPARLLRGRNSFGARVRPAHARAVSRASTDRRN